VHRPQYEGTDGRVSPADDARGFVIRAYRFDFFGDHTSTEGTACHFVFFFSSFFLYLFIRKKKRKEKTDSFYYGGDIFWG
jgi:hypothetical protein